MTKEVRHEVGKGKPLLPSRPPRATPGGRPRDLGREVVTEMLVDRINKLAAENLILLKFIQDLQPVAARHKKRRLFLLHKHGIQVKKNPGRNCCILLPRRK